MNWKPRGGAQLTRVSSAAVRFVAPITRHTWPARLCEFFPLVFGVDNLTKVATLLDELAAEDREANAGYFVELTRYFGGLCGLTKVSRLGPKISADNPLLHAKSCILDEPPALQ